MAKTNLNPPGDKTQLTEQAQISRIIPNTTNFQCTLQLSTYHRFAFLTPQKFYQFTTTTTTTTTTTINNIYIILIND